MRLILLGYHGGVYGAIGKTRCRTTASLDENHDNSNSGDKTTPSGRQKKFGFEHALYSHSFTIGTGTATMRRSFFLIVYVLGSVPEFFGFVFTAWFRFQENRFLSFLVNFVLWR